MKLRRERDQVGQLADRLEVTERGQPLEAEGVEVIAGEQGQIGVGADHHARLPVVQQVTLANRLDHERVLAPRLRRSRAGRGQQTKRRLGPPGIGGVRRDHRLLGLQLLGQRVEDPLRDGDLGHRSARLSAPRRRVPDGAVRNRRKCAGAPSWPERSGRR